MKTKHIIMIVVGAVLLITAIIVVIGIIAVGNYSQVRDKAEISKNRMNAAIICNATNTYNVLSDEDSWIVELPETKKEYDKINTDFQISMDEDDYTNALPYIAYDEDDGEFIVLESLD